MSSEVLGSVKDEDDTSMFQWVGRLAQVTAGCQLGGMFEGKTHGCAKLCHFDWLGIKRAEDAEKKPFCIWAKLWGKVGQHLDSSALWGFSVWNYSAPVLFFNLSNYLACLSFCFCSYSMLLFYHPPSITILHSSFKTKNQMQQPKIHHQSKAAG